MNASTLKEIKMEVVAELGRALPNLESFAGLSVGSVVKLDKFAGVPVDLRVSGLLFARGDVVVIDECYGVRITEIREDSK